MAQVATCNVVGVGRVTIVDSFYGKYPFAAHTGSGKTFSWLSGRQYKRVTRRFSTLETAMKAAGKSTKEDYVRAR